MTPTPITKETFLSARVCPTLGWYLRNQDSKLPPSEGELFRMEQGKEIGRLARTLFPLGVLIPSGTIESASKKTRVAVSNLEWTTLFEATFCIDGYVAKPDILLREPGGWRIIEVKSSLSGTNQLAGLIDDLTYTVMVMQRAGMNIVAAELMLINRAYRKGQPTSQLFERLDQTEAVNVRLMEFDAVWDTLASATAANHPPTPKLTSACRSCPNFQTDCLGQGIEHTIFSLPRLHPNRIAALAADDIVDLMKLPAGFPLTPRQQRVVDCVKDGRHWVSPELGGAFTTLEWPVSYLDFESVMTALPLYDDMAPYVQVTTQYSIHRRQQPQADLEHVDYLADPLRDCEEELAERLIADCGERGSIFVYSSFEKTRINALAARFPKFAVKLMDLSARLFDLLKVIQDGYYHLGFKGSYSIKAVLPVMVPELRYDGLAIGNGDAAIARFARAAMGQCSALEVEQIRNDLRTYCKQDTFAMVRLHESLVAICTCECANLK